MLEHFLKKQPGSGISKIHGHFSFDIKCSAIFLCEKSQLLLLLFLLLLLLLLLLLFYLINQNTLKKLILTTDLCGTTLKEFKLLLLTHFYLLEIVVKTIKP